MLFGSNGGSGFFGEADGEAGGGGEGGDSGGEVIHLMEFVGAGFRAATAIVRPWAEIQESSFFAELKVLSGWLEPFAEAQITQDNHATSIIYCGSYDFFFDFVDCRRNWNRSFGNLLPTGLGVMLELLFTPASMDSYWEQIRLLKEKHIAESGICMSGYYYVEMTLEKIGMITADEKAAGIVDYVLNRAVELLVIEDDLVIKWPEQGGKVLEIE